LEDDEIEQRRGRRRNDACAFGDFIASREEGEAQAGRGATKKVCWADAATTASAARPDHAQRVPSWAATWRAESLLIVKHSCHPKSMCNCIPLAIAMIQLQVVFHFLSMCQAYARHMPDLGNKTHKRICHVYASVMTFSWKFLRLAYVGQGIYLGYEIVFHMPSVCQHMPFIWSTLPYVYVWHMTGVCLEYFWGFQMHIFLHVQVNLHVQHIVSHTLHNILHILHIN
jgi:hypothetical protein